MNLPLLTNLFPDCGANMGGLHYLKVIPVENVISIPKATGHIITSQIELVNQANYLNIFFAQETGSFEETAVETEHGEYFKQSLKVYVPKDTPEAGYFANALTGIRCIAIYQDSNEFIKVVGSKKSPLTYLPKLDTNNSSSSKNGHEFTFTGVSLHKAYFYGHFEIAVAGTRKHFSKGFNFGFRRS